MTFSWDENPCEQTECGVATYHLQFVNTPSLWVVLSFISAKSQENMLSLNSTQTQTIVNNQVIGWHYSLKSLLKNITDVSLERHLPYPQSPFAFSQISFFWFQYLEFYHTLGCPVLFWMLQICQCCRFLPHLHHRKLK